MTVLYQGYTAIRANADLDALNARVNAAATAPWGPSSVVGSFVGLNYTYRGGTILSGGAYALVADGSVVLANNATNYVQRTTAGIVSSNTTGFTTDQTPMAVVITAAGAIANVADWRPQAAGLFYPLAVGETASTITSYAYPVGNLYRYGATGGTGATNDTVAFTAAQAAALATGFPVVLQPGNIYKIDSLKLTQGIVLLGNKATIKLSGVSAKGLYTDNASSGTIGTATFITGLVVRDLVLDMALMPNVGTSYALYLKYSYQNEFKNVKVINCGAAAFGLGMGSGCYTTAFDNCVIDNIQMLGAASPETITTITFNNLDCLGSIDLTSCSTIRFNGPTMQGSGAFQFQMTGCTNIVWSGGDYECVNYAGVGTVACVAGAATFNTAQGTVNMANNGLVFVAGVPYRVTNYNSGARTCTLTGALGTAGAGVLPTFAAAAFTIGTVLFRFVGAGNQNMKEVNSTLNGFLGSFLTGAPTHGDFESQYDNTQNTDPTINGRYLYRLGKFLIDTVTGWVSLTGTIPRPSPGGFDLGLLSLMHSNSVGYYTGDANDATGQAMVKTAIRDSANDVYLGTPDKDVSAGVNLCAANRGVRAKVSTAGSALVDYGGFDATGNLEIMVAGKGLKIKEATNGKMNAATLVGGTVTIANTAVTASSRIFAFCQYPGGTPGWLQVSSRVAGTSFTILSSNAADTSIIAWIIVEPS
jgi:hypothetical protein